MTLALVRSRALRGLDAPAVTAEVHLAHGLPSFTLVGLADTKVKESREHVRAALQTSGLELPHNQRVTVSLAPADLPKGVRSLRRPIALGILATAGQIDAQLERFEFAGDCRSAARCGRCTVRWRWRSHVAAPPRRFARWFCRRLAPTSPRWSAGSRGAAPACCRRSRTKMRSNRPQS